MKVLFVQVPNSQGAMSDREVMKRADNEIQQYGAMCHLPLGEKLPLPCPDGSFEVRCFSLSSIVKHVLENNFGLKILRESELDCD